MGGKSLQAISHSVLHTFATVPPPIAIGDIIADQLP